MKTQTFQAVKMAINPALPSDEINEHLLFVTTTCLFQLAELNGNDFMQGFLHGASVSFDKGEKFGDLSVFFEEDHAAQ
jgi:hypothetical protein